MNTHWNATYGTVWELTENDEGYDPTFIGTQLFWEKPEEKK